jgi:hypothetical protein
MSSDTARHAPDVHWRHIGTGMSQRFRCARCDKPSESQGRKLQRVQGVRQYVCKGCAK